MFAAEASMREAGVPARDICEAILERDVDVKLMGDNQTTAISDKQSPSYDMCIAFMG